MTAQEKNQFSNDAYLAVEHPMVAEVMSEYAGNMGFELRGLPLYGLRKIAQHVAVIARAQALGVDIETLRMTPEEADEAQRDLIRSLMNPKD